MTKITNPEHECMISPVVYLIGNRAGDFEKLTALLVEVRFRVRTYQTAEVFLSRSDKRRGVAIVDQHLPGMDGIALLRRLLEEHSALSTIFISSTADTRLTVEAMRLGAHDVIDKPLDANGLANLVTRLCTRDQRRRECLSSATACAARINLLSSRQRQVFDAVTEGLTNKEIANNLRISPRTIETHRLAIRQKLGTASSMRWVRAAVELEQDSAFSNPVPITDHGHI